MNLPQTITDNITELLVKIIEFTHARQKILTKNINGLSRPGFVPMDLMVDEFSELLNDALDEHIRSRWLVLCDTESIKFGADGFFEARPVVDEPAKALLEEDRNEYLEFQVSKLLENSLNQRAAAELLKQKQKDSMDSDVVYRGFGGY